MGTCIYENIIKILLRISFIFNWIKATSYSKTVTVRGRNFYDQVVLLWNEGKATDVVCLLPTVSKHSHIIKRSCILVVEFFFIGTRIFIAIMEWQNSTDTWIILCGHDSLSNKNYSSKFKLVFPVTPRSGKVVHYARNMRNSIYGLSLSVCVLWMKFTVNLTDDT